MPSPYKKNEKKPVKKKTNKGSWTAAVTGGLMCLCAIVGVAVLTGPTSTAVVAGLCLTLFVAFWQLNFINMVTA